METNPFKPTAGKMPPILIGRQSIIDDFTDGLANGAGAPGRLMLITGQRGYGKTVMLTEFRRIAQREGWISYADTASEGLCGRLVEALEPQNVHLDGASISPSIDIAGIASVSLGEAKISASEQGPLTLRKAIEEKLESRKIKKGKGILITIDETQASSRDEIVAIGTAIQHVIADQDLLDIPDDEKKGVALVFAGLPELVDGIINDRVLTFLRRALRRELREVPIPDVRNAFVESVRESGKDISLDLASEAARISDGYPYMIQLVGYYMWQAAQRDSRKTITSEDVEIAREDALFAFGNAVCAPALNGLNASELEFIKALAKCHQAPAKTAELLKISGRSRSWISKHRERLTRKRIVRTPSRGEVEFAIPHMAEYLNGEL